MTSQLHSTKMKMNTYNEKELVDFANQEVNRKQQNKKEQKRKDNKLKKFLEILFNI
jgi:hypothetical protein